jgi:eukaryotic-like serine/threonine-protein kinase
MFEPGTRVGDYEILDLLHSSRKERVYRVRNVVADRIEMLKILPDSLRGDREARERFYREIKLHARLSHPNLITFYHAAEIEGVTIMTTELVEGITLADKLTAGPMPVRKALDMMGQVLAGLAHAHRQNLVHREVTPENILILPDGQVKLGGFGLVKQRGDMSLTAVGTTLGCVDYMSPEQIKGVSELDARTDIYSAACVLYEVLSGRKPFEAKSQFDVMACHVQRDAVNLHTLNPALPKPVAHVIARAMAKQPEDRYASAETFSAALLDSSLRRDSAPLPAVNPTRAVDHQAPPIQIPIAPAAVSTESNWRLHTLAAGLLLSIVVLLGMVLR